MKDNIAKLVEKWKPLLEDSRFTPIDDMRTLQNTAVLLENNDRALAESSTANTPAMASFDPVMMQVVRRSSPVLVAYDLCGVQPMTMPTGVVFAMRARYIDQPAQINHIPGQAGIPASVGEEALFNEADYTYSGTKQGRDGTNPFDGSTYSTGSAMETAVAETSKPADMGLSIEKVTVTAKTRQLRASASIEIRQDLAAVHGMDADAELARILSEELMFETNRELIRTIYTIAKQGSANTGNPGTYDLLANSDGRWLAERAKALWFHIQREANQVGIETRRGKGNVLLCSVDVAALLGIAGIMQYAPGMTGSYTTVDVTGPSYVGNIADIKVYVDPYVTGNGFVVGYRGANSMDAGLFYCPYVSATLFNATDPVTLAPVLGIKSRYALVGNPFAQQGMLLANSNPYFRKTQVLSL